MDPYAGHRFSKDLPTKDIGMYKHKDIVWEYDWPFIVYMGLIWLCIIPTAFFTTYTAVDLQRSIDNANMMMIVTKDHAWVDKLFVS